LLDFADVVIETAAEDIIEIDTVVLSSWTYMRLLASAVVAVSPEVVVVLLT
jgi:hypothetical protein